MIDNFANIFSKLNKYGYQVAAVGSQQYFPIENWPKLAKEFISKGTATFDYVLMPMTKTSATGI